MRRFIYLDTDTLNSYLAQIFDGLIQSQEMEKSAGKKKENGSCKKLGKIYRSRGEFYAPKSVNRSFAARLWAANKDSAPKNFTRYIQTHCKSRAILYGKLRVPLFQGGV